jgi:hypothetical protein
VQAFCYCTTLTTVNIPYSTTIIKMQAFYICNRLATAYFYGPAPTMASGVFDNCAANFTIYYHIGTSSYTTPTWYGYPSYPYGQPDEVTVKFDSQGGTPVGSQTIDYNSTVVKPSPAPTRSNCKFLGWYTDTTYKTAWNFTTKVTSNRTLYARWLKNAVTGVTAKPAGYRSVKLTWTADSGADKYEIWQTTSTGTRIKKLSVVTAPATTYTASGLTTGLTYYFRVRAYAIPLGVTVYAPAYSVVVSAKPVLLNPASFAAKSASYNSVKLTWGVVAEASGYQVYRANASTGPFTLIKALASYSTVSFTNTLLTTGKTYYYKIRAYRNISTTSKIYSAYTAVKAVKPVPAVPGSYLVSRVSPTSIRVNWAAVSGASGYEVWRSVSAGGTFSRVTSTTAISWLNTGLVPNTVYFYKVCAFRIVNGVKIFGSFTVVKRPAT